jgi:hypothetical protein
VQECSNPLRLPLGVARQNSVDLDVTGFGRSAQRPAGPADRLWFLAFEITVASAIPPELTIAVPPLLMKVASATPPELTISWPPFDTDVTLAVPPTSTMCPRLLPLNTDGPATALWPLTKP